MLYKNPRPGGGGNPSPFNFFLLCVGRAAELLVLPSAASATGTGKEREKQIMATAKKHMERSHRKKASVPVQMFASRAAVKQSIKNQREMGKGILSALLHRTAKREGRGSPCQE